MVTAHAMSWVFVPAKRMSNGPCRHASVRTNLHVMPKVPVMLKNNANVLETMGVSVVWNAKTIGMETTVICIVIHI
jgi:hypothetical protein